MLIFADTLLQNRDVPISQNVLICILGAYLVLEIVFFSEIYRSKSGPSKKGLHYVFEKMLCAFLNDLLHKKREKRSTP